MINTPYHPCWVCWYRLEFGVLCNTCHKLWVGWYRRQREGGEEFDDTLELYMQFLCIGWVTLHFQGDIALRDSNIEGI